MQAGSTVYLAEQLSEQPGHTELREQERWTFLQVDFSGMYHGLKLILMTLVRSFVTYGRLRRPSSSSCEDLRPMAKSFTNSALWAELV